MLSFLSSDIHIPDSADLPSSLAHQRAGGASEGAPNGGSNFNTESQDSRPKEDYDEPWEWSAKQSMMFQSQLENMGPNIPPHFLPPTTQICTPQLKKSTNEETNEVKAESPNKGRYSFHMLSPYKIF